MAELTPEQQRILILAQARRQRQEQDSDGPSGATRFVQGANTGLIADTLGLPVDAMNALMQLGEGAVTEMTGRDVRGMLTTEEPIGGSASIQRGLSAVGGAPEPGSAMEQDPTFGVGRITGQGVGIAATGGAAAGPRAVATATGRAAAPTTTGGRIAGDIGRTTVDAPVRTLAAESAAGAAAGTAGVSAAQQFPNSPGARALAEVIGGLSPAAAIGAVRGAVRVLDFATNKVPVIGTLRRIVFPRGEQRAQARFDEAIGADREQAVANLGEETLEEANLTPAQHAGVPGALALERSIANETTAGIAQRDRQLAQAAVAIRRSLTGTAPEGQQPVPFDEARNYLGALLETRITIAARAAEEQIERLGVTATRNEINEVAAETMERALSASVSQKRQAFDAVPHDAVIDSSNAWAAHERIAAQLTPENMADMPAIARRAFRVGEDGLPVEGALPLEASVRRMENFAFKMLEIQRQARRDGHANQARIAGTIADGLFADMDAALAATGDDSLRIALGYAADHRRLFTQGPVGRLLGFQGTGERTIDPALFLERSVGRGGPQGRVEALAILNAVERSGNQPAMQSSIEDYLRQRFVETTMRDGRITDSGVRTFYNRFGEVLQEMPEMRQMFDNAVRVGNTSALRRLEASGTSLRNPDISVASVFIERTPEQAFNQVLDHPQASQQMGELIQMARRDPSGRAMAGLRTGFGEWMIERGFDDAASLQRMAGISTPETDAERRIAAMGRVLLTSEQRDRLRVIANTAQRVEAAIRAGAAPEGVLNDPPANMRNFLATYLATHTVSQGGVAGPGQLVIAGRAGGFARRIASRVFGDKAPRLLAEGMADGSLFEAMTRPLTSPQAEAFVRRRLNAWMAGVLERQAEGEAEEREIDITEGTLVP